MTEKIKNKTLRLSLTAVLAGCMLAGCRYASPTAEDTQLAEKAELLAKKAENTPGRHIGHYITKNYFGRRSIKRLKGKRNANAKELEAARKSIKKKMEALESAATWPEPASVEIPYAATPPAMDGNINEPAWKNALTFEGAYPLSKTEKKNGIDIIWKIMWDKNYIYFAIKCSDSDIIAPKLKRDGYAYCYDSFEIFMMTDKEMGGYWEMIISPSGTIFDSLQTANRAAWMRISRNHRNMKGIRTGISVDGSLNNSGDTDKGFVIEAALPFSEMPGYMKGNKPAPGDKASFMLVKTDISQKNKKTEYYAVQPLLYTCHNTWNYINATLVKKQ